MLWRWLACMMPLSLAACGSDDRSCTAVACVGLVEVPLVTESGQPASARGELRSRQTDPDVQRFNCNDDRAPDEQPCPGGIILIQATSGTPPALELRFQRPDNSFTDWQLVDLAIEPITNPDFNGPGCPCTSYEGHPNPITVPTTALIPTD
jgi:hypothetical protein